MIRSLFHIFHDSLNSFEGQAHSEKVLILIRKHPFFILLKIALVLLACLVPIIVGIYFWNYLGEQGWRAIFLFASSLWYLIFWLSIFYTLMIYTLNTIIVTDQRIIENQQKGFFNRKVSELYSQRIQDVTAHTKGLIETFLSFGNVVVQTAASEREFCFSQIPHPEIVKDVIMKIVSAKHSGVKL